MNTYSPSESAKCPKCAGDMKLTKIYNTFLLKCKVCNFIIKNGDSNATSNLNGRFPT